VVPVLTMYGTRPFHFGTFFQSLNKLVSVCLLTYSLHLVSVHESDSVTIRKNIACWFQSSRTLFIDQFINFNFIHVIRLLSSLYLLSQFFFNYVINGDTQSGLLVDN